MSAGPSRKWLLLCAFFALSIFAEFSAALQRRESPRERRDAVLSVQIVGEDEVLSTRDETKPALRILSLGASIMWGYKSFDNNGCRKWVRDTLRSKGFQVDMVGNTRNGNMTDNDVSAHPGDTIAQVTDRAKLSVVYKPNVVMVNVGSNDAKRNIAIDEAQSRYETLLEVIWNTKGYENPDACVVFSLLSLIGEDVDEGRSVSINKAIRDVWTKYRGEGKCMYLANLRTIDPATGKEWMQIGPDIRADDGVHPTDRGYEKMGSILVNGIMAAYGDGKIAAPSSAALDLKSCKTSAADVKRISGTAQATTGTDDGVYTHDSKSMGSVLEVTSSWDREQWFTAKLFSRDKDDVLEWYNKTATDHRFNVWRNTGSTTTAKFTKVGELLPKISCPPAGINFVDMNGDGLDDLVCIDANGGATLSVNKGDGSSTKSPTFAKAMDKNGLVFEGKAAQKYIRMADIDGDGRADYVWVKDSGEMRVWRNGGSGDVPKYWEDLGVRGTMKAGDVAGVRFADLTGGNGDDWLWVADDGTASTYTNARSCAQGKIGDGLSISWREGVSKSKKTSPTHASLSSYQKTQGRSLRPAVRFAKIYGDAPFASRPRSDYVLFNRTKIAGGKFRFNVLVWKNTAVGGARLKMDGNKYCNMMGRASGGVDLVWTWPSGQMDLYLNAGKKNLTSKETFWGKKVEAIWSPKASLGKDLDYRDLHLADWDGDGACDIIWTDPQNDNRVSVWLNKYPKLKTWQFEYVASPAPELSCKQKRGKAVSDVPVRMHDITGSNRTDYLCIEPNGRITGFARSGSSSAFKNMNQIKVQETKNPELERANLRWTDVDGDGKADMLYVDKFSGDAAVWYNQGEVKNIATNANSTVKWQKSSAKAFAGSYAGTCQSYPDLDGNGRGDMVSVTDSVTNVGFGWLSPDCGLPNAKGDDAREAGEMMRVPSKNGGVPQDDEDFEEGGSSTTTSTPAPTPSPTLTATGEPESEETESSTMGSS